MKRFFTLGVLGLLIVAGCSNPKKPSNGNFTRAINQALSTRGKACVLISGQFPVDVPLSQLTWRKQDVDRLTALENAGLVKSSDTTAVPQGSFAPEKPQPVKRFDLTDLGKQYLHQQPGFSGSSAGFCYGQEVVDSIVKWNEPATAGGFTVTVVTYTYRLDGLADWAQKPEVVTQYPEVRQELDGARVQQRTMGLQLTNRGWDAGE